MTDSERKDYYEILGVEPHTNIKLVKNAYLQLMQKFQSEGDESPEAQARIKLIQEAYEVLTDPQRRLDYDSPGQIYSPETDEEFHQENSTRKSTYRSTSLRPKRTISRGTGTSTPQGIGAKIWIPICIIILIAAGGAAVYFLDPFEKDEVAPEPVIEVPTPVVIVTEPTPPDADSYFESGKELLAQGYYSEAIDELNQAIALGINNKDVYIYRGDAYFGDGQYDLAIADYSTLLDLDSDSPEIIKKRGIAYAKIGEYKLAIEDDSTAIDLNPSDDEAYSNRGSHYFSSIGAMDPSTYKSGHANLALTDFETAIGLDPSNARYYYSRGLVHNLYRLYDLAITDFTEAVILDPEFIDAYWERGELYMNMEQYQSAAEDFARIIEVDPGIVDAYYWRGHAYHLLGLYDLAIADLDVVLDRDATAKIQSERGFCYLEKGDLTKAILDFDMCTIYHPAFADAWLGRAQVYHLLGDDTKAIADLEIYISRVIHDAGLVGQARQLINDWGN